jgi:hypothetical protein
VAPTESSASASADAPRPRRAARAAAAPVDLSTLDPVRLDAALVEEAARKSSLLWLTLPELAQPRAAWHVWVDGAVAVVHEGDEQTLPGLRDLSTVEISLRSKDKGSLLVRVPARVVALTPGEERFDAAVAALHAARQSAPDGEAQPARWAAMSLVTRLEPAGPSTERPGAYDDASLRAEPVATPATTRSRLPFVLGRRARRRPKL